MNPNFHDRWVGLRESARARIETRDYTKAELGVRLGSTGVGGGELVSGRAELGDVWIPGVEVFKRQVYQQKGRGYFSELGRLNEGLLNQIGIEPKQWASALMHRDSAKGFHIHPPFIPDGVSAEDWFKRLFLQSPCDYTLRCYDREQWDVMFFLTGLCEMVLVDERAGMDRRVMRFTIFGDSRPGPDNVAVVIPPGVAHALRSIGNEDLVMAYGTSTSFNPDWEGRIASDVENAPLPVDWANYLGGSSLG
jgi:dTDP-4-dehydrorhamnose 3,5-epimerase-like enzyme